MIHLPLLLVLRSGCLWYGLLAFVQFLLGVAFPLRLNEHFSDNSTKAWNDTPLFETLRQLLNPPKETGARTAIKLFWVSLSRPNSLSWFFSSELIFDLHHLGCVHHYTSFNASLQFSIKTLSLLEYWRLQTFPVTVPVRSRFLSIPWRVKRRRRVTSHDER